MKKVKDLDLIAGVIRENLNTLKDKNVIIVTNPIPISLGDKDLYYRFWLVNKNNSEIQFRGYVLLDDILKRA